MVPSAVVADRIASMVADMISITYSPALLDASLPKDSGVWYRAVRGKEAWQEDGFWILI
jgi:hypothetical protein